MSKLITTTLTVIGAAIAVLAGGAALPEDASAATTVCPQKKLQVTIQATFGLPDNPAAGTLGNGCWSYVKLHNVQVAGTGVKYCKHDTARRVWAYDDTSPLHDLNTEKTRQNHCSTIGGHDGAGWQGYQLMAYRGGGFRRLAHPRVSKHFLQLYTHLGQVSNPTVMRVWKQHRSNTAPMVNIGKGMALADISAAIREICATSGVTSLGLYGESGTTERPADRRRRRNHVVTLINQCMKRVPAPAPVVPVAPGNQRPVATNQRFTMQRNQWYAPRLDAHDPEKNGLRYRLVSQSFAQANFPTFAFGQPFSIKIPSTATRGGTIHFTYEVTDDRGATDTAMVVIDIV